MSGRVVSVGARHRFHTIGGAQVYTGIDTVRTAHCGKPSHLPTTDFMGVNGMGWVFRCRGAEKDGSETHAFVAAPPERP